MNNKLKKLNKIFNPKSVAIIGANSKPKTVGWGLVKNLLDGKSKRKIFAVNPYAKNVLGLKCFSSIKDIEEMVDLAIIAVPAKIVFNVVQECCRAKVGGIIVVSAGFSEIGGNGIILEKKIQNIVREAKIPLIGPNCLGIINTGNSLNATFAPETPNSGNISFISQSGALIDSIIDESLTENYGFSDLISYGNEADVSLVDFLEWEEKNERTKIIALYLEGLKNGKDVLKILKRISNKKPILAIKAGKTKSGEKTVSSHTGSLAGNYQVYQALFKQAGVIEVDTVQDLFAMAKALSWQPRCKNGIGIITNGGGCGVLLADYCESLGIKMPKLNKKTIKKLETSNIMHIAQAERNPLDIIGDALSNRYSLSIESLLEQPNINGLIIVQTLQIMTETEKNAKIIIEAKNKFKGKPIITAFLGGRITKKGIELLENNKIPNYKDLKTAALAMKALLK